MLPLARDQHGNGFEVPTEAAYWRVRRHTGGRPSTVLGPDGEPLFIPIGADRLDLNAHGCTGSLRLEAVDGDYHPVDAPVAYVEIAESDTRLPDRNASVGGHADLVRVGFESMTRTMEAMQRAQVERERALAEKERSLSDAQVAMNRNHTELMISLIQSATGGKPQDPVAVLEQHVKLQKVIDRQGQRNAGLLMPTSTTSDDGNEGGGKAPSWMAALLPWTPLATQMVAKMFGKNEKKAEEIGRNSAAILNGVTQLQNDDPAGIQALQDGIVGSIAATTDNQPAPVASESPREVRGGFVRPRVLRELLAHLDDDAAEAFDEFLDTLDGNAFDRVVETASSFPTLDERAQWARRFIAQQSAEVSEPASAATLPDVPPELIPVLSQLTPEERMVGAQILLKLDRASVDDFVSKLAAMPPDLALKKIRQAIAEAERRSASVAHRAVRAAMADETDGAVS